MSLYGYQLTSAQKSWFENNIEGYYQHAPYNLEKIIFLMSDSPLPDFKVYNPSLEITPFSFLLVGDGMAVQLLLNAGWVWRDLRAVGIGHIPTINIDPRFTQDLNNTFEKMKPMYAHLDDITHTFFNSNGSIGGSFFSF